MDRLSDGFVIVFFFVPTHSRRRSVVTISSVPRRHLPLGSCERVPQHHARAFPSRLQRVFLCGNVREFPHIFSGRTHQSNSQFYLQHAQWSPWQPLSRFDTNTVAVMIPGTLTLTVHIGRHRLQKSRWCSQISQRCRHMRSRVPSTVAL